MDRIDQLRMAIDDVLISGVGSETKIEQIISVMKTHAHCFDGLIIGWLDVHVRAPERNDYIDVRWSDGTVIYERLCTQQLEQQMRQRAALWKPAIH